MAGICCRSTARSIVARSYRDIANAILADQSGADHGEAAQGHQPTWLRLKSAWARYCAEGVTPSQPSNVAYIGNR
jgi:hypothetical protein